MRKSLWLLSAGLFALTQPAWAQDAGELPGGQPDVDTREEQGGEAQDGGQATAGDSNVDDAASVDNNDIIVTATRRSQALSDVPLAVSAVLGDTLENSGATDIRQLTQLSPSLLVSSTSSEAGAGTARIRGIGTVGDNPGLESSVAVFIDGVYRSRNGTALTELGAIDRIEVLRGPQGTLFGRNASAGLISVITARPRFQFESQAQLSYGNYDFVRAEAGITGPITETLAFRLDGIYQQRDGFVTDVISGRDLNDRDRYLVRGQLLYEPSDRLEVRIIGDYADRNEECCGASYLPFGNVSLGPDGSIVRRPSSIAGILRGLGAVITDDTFERETSITPGQGYRQDVTDWGISGEVVYDLGSAELTSITAYRDFEFIRGQDADFNNLAILQRPGDGRGFQKFQTFSQELRVQGELFNGRLDWLIGGYFADEELTVRDNLEYGADYERYSNCLLFAAVLPSAVQPTPTGNCVNSAVLGGTISQLTAGIAQLTAGIAQVQAGIAALSAIPPESRTPAQQAQLAALQAQLPKLQAQLASLRTSAGTLGALNANPARPGFGSIAAALGQPGLTLNGVGLDDLYVQKSRNFAIFTHNIIEVTDRLNLTLGLRYTNERKTLDATLTDNNVLCRLIGASPLAALQALPCVIPSVPGGSFTQEDARRKENEFSGTAVVSYKPTDRLLTYVSYSRGYKAGGFNLDRSALPRRIVGTAAGPVLATADLNDLQFEEENVDAIEIGAKYNGPDFDLNVTAFRQVFDNFQLNTFNGINFVVENVNSCKDGLEGADTDNNPTTGACPGKVEGGVESRGVEIEAFLRPAPDFSVNLGATIVDTEYREDLVGANGRPLTNALFQLPGRRVSNSSLYTLTGSATWTPRLGNSGLTGLVYGDYRLQSEFNTGSDLDVEKIQQAYFVVNARIGVRGPESRWGIELWAQNLFDEDYQQIAFDAPLQGSGTTRAVQAGFIPVSTQLFSAFLAEPRTYGITGRIRF